MNNFLLELSRRNMIKATIAYLMVAGLLLRLFIKFLPPNWVITILTSLITIGFLISVTFNLLYIFTPEDIIRIFKVQKKNSISDKTNNRSNILIGLNISIVFSFITESVLYKLLKYISDLLTDKSIIVLSFNDMSSESDSQWFCDGLHKISYLDKYLSNEKVKIY